MPLDTVGILTPIDFSAEQPTVLSAVWREIFVNENPLYSRLPHVQATSEVYSINRYDVRQRSYQVGTGGITNVATSLPISDASPFQDGDVLEITDGSNTERVEVTAAPSLSPTPNTLTIRRAREGTAAAAFVATNTITLIGNSRTGGEIDQQGFRSVSTPTEQYLQTFQYPVQVGGKAEAISNVALPPGANSVMGRDRAIKLVEAIRDVEYSMYYGTGEKPAAGGDRAKMRGLKKLIQLGASGNVKLAAGTSYTRANFIVDTISKIYSAGGMPDTILCSTDFLAGLDVWVPTKTAMMGNGTTSSLGFPITTFVLPLTAQPLTFVPSLQLRTGSAFILSSGDLDVRFIREMYWQPREKRGDAWEGDWIGDYAINVGHPSYHAYVEGITSYA